MQVAAADIGGGGNLRRLLGRGHQDHRARKGDGQDLMQVGAL